MLPLPFTVSAVLMFVAISISKLQYQASKIVIAVHALLGPLETGTLIYTLVTYLGKDYQNSLVFILFLVAISFFGMFNFFGFAIQTPFIVEDRHFLKWMRRRQQKFDMKLNFYWFYLITLLSILTSFKLKYILFSSLFNFDCLKCKLQSVQKFRIFNIFSFLGLVPEIITLYCAIVTITALNSGDSFFLVLLDTIIIFILNIIFSVLAANKEKDFFKEELDGLSLNKIYNVPGQSFHSSNGIGANLSLGRTLEDIIELDEYAYRTTMRETDAPKNGQEQDIEKISECTQEQNTAKTSEKCELVVTNKAQEDNIRQTHNILMIDEIYSFDQHLPQPPQDINDIELVRTAAEPQKCQQIPKIKSVQIPNKYQEELSQQSQGQRLQRTERVNLAEYLLSLQHQQRSAKLKQPKYDKILTEPNLPQKLLNKLKTSLIEQLKTIPTEKRYTFQEQDQQLTQKSQHTNNEAVMLKQIERSPIEAERHDCIELGQNIKRVIASHMPGKKTIKTEKEDNNLLKYRVVSGRNFKINEDHGEQPIRNKSKDKISVYENNPIHNRSLPYPINNQRITTGDHESLQDWQADKGRKIQNTKIKRQRILDRQQRNSCQRRQHSQQHNGKTYISQIFQSKEHNGGCSQYQKQSRQKQFKRSSPQIQTLFPPKISQALILEERVVGDRVPRKPIASSQLRFFSQSKSLENMRSMSTNEGRKRRSKNRPRLDNYLKGQDRKKMKSLEKIYLDKQIK